MMLGAMNNPNKSVAKEIARFGELGFGYVDLTAEAPQATPELLLKHEKQIRDALSATKLKVVGHTPWFMEISHPYESIRKAILSEMKASISACAKFGAEKVGIHPDPMAFIHPGRDKFLSVYSDSVAELNSHAKDLGVALLIETYEDKFLKPDELEKIFLRLPDARFTLDVGHAFLNGGDASIERMVKKFADRLLHVHASDNNGK
jgi:sugar phosphate isomerase/epimerase